MGGKSKDPNKAAMKQQKRQMARLDAIDLPELEEYLLQSPELVGLLDAEEMEGTSFDEIQEDQSLKQAQMDALRQMQETGEVGLTPEERAQRAEMLRESAAQGQAAQKQILQSMAQRGNLDSGSSLLAQLQANAQQSSDARRQSEQMAADVSSRRRDAINRASGMAGQMSQQDMARQTNLASARDRISQFNAAQRAGTARMNLGAQQNIENQRAAIANQQSQVGNQIAQQNFQNELSKATGQGGIANNMSQIAANTPQGPSTGQMLGTVAGGILGASAGPAGAMAGASAGGAIGGALGFEDGGLALNDAFAQARKEQGAGGQFDWQGNSYNTNYANEAAPKKMTEAEMDAKYGAGQVSSGKMTEKEFMKNRQEKEQEKKDEQVKDIQAAGELAKMLGPQEQERSPLELQDAPQMNAQNIMQPMGGVEFGNAFMAEDGGIYEGTQFAKDGSIMFNSTGDGAVVGGDSFERDRVDARLNSGEAVLNVAQQQRLMDILRGKEDTDALGNEDIVEGVPSDYQEDLKDKVDNTDKMSKGLKRLIEALGE